MQGLCCLRVRPQRSHRRELCELLGTEPAGEPRTGPHRPRIFPAGAVRWEVCMRDIALPELSVPVPVAGAITATSCRGPPAWQSLQDALGRQSPAHVLIPWREP